MKTQTTAYKAEMAKRIRPSSIIEVSVTVNNVAYVFSETTITNATITNVLDPLSRSLPTEEFTFTVADPTGEYDPSNPNGKWIYFDRDAPVEVKFGLTINNVRTFLASDTYWLDGRPSTSSGQVTFVASGRLGRLKGHYYKDASVSAILSDAGLTSSDYDIDWYELNRRFPTAKIPGFRPCTHAEALQYFAHACGMALYTRGGKITMKRIINISPEPSYTEKITLGDIAQGGIVLQKQDDIGTLRKISYGTIPSTGNAETVYSGSVVMPTGISVKRFHFEFDEFIYNPIASSSITVAQTDVYPYAVDVVLSGSGTPTITVTGERIKEETSETSETLGTGDAEESIENPLLNFESTTDLAAAWLAQDYEYYLPKRNTYAIQFRGSDAIEAGDSLLIETIPNNFIKALVLGVRTQYNGALSTTLTVKEMGRMIKLLAPTISVNPNLKKLIISRKQTQDETYEIYIDGTLSDTVSCDGAVTLWDMPDLSVGNHTVEVIAQATDCLGSEKATTSATIVSVYYLLINITKSMDAPSKAYLGGSFSFTLTATMGHTLPDAITVSNATHTYNKTTGAVSVLDITNSVAVSATA